MQLSKESIRANLRSPDLLLEEWKGPWIPTISPETHHGYHGHITHSYRHEVSRSLEKKRMEVIVRLALFDGSELTHLRFQP